MPLFLTFVSSFAQLREVRATVAVGGSEGFISVMYIQNLELWKSKYPIRLMRKFYCVFLGLLLLCFSTHAQAVKFKIKNFGLVVDGSFSDPKGDISFNPQNLEDANFNITIDAASINTGIDLRDKHLRKEEYLDIETYPHIKFASTKFDLLISLINGN